MWRHRYALPLMLALFALTLALAVLAMPYPWIRQPTATKLFSGPSIGDMPLLAMLYPVFILLCIVLSIDALLHTRGAGPIEELAHRRARAWLLATAACLLLVAGIIGVMMMAAAEGGRQAILEPHGPFPGLVIWGDVIISMAVAVAVLCLGQAIVSYEIFTGKALPRRGLRAQWYGAIFLSGMYSTAAAWAVAVEDAPFYGLLLATVLVVIFYALYNWRAYAERDRSMRQLLPVVQGPALFETLRQGQEAELDTAAPFAALCEQTLAARVAYLIPVGPLAALAGPPLAYPVASSAVPADVTALIDAASQADLPLLVLDPQHYGGALWALPLWTERGLVGLLLLGEKRGLGLYSQEEMEIARASAARLVDSIACGRLAQRLMRLQRQRLAETQVADRRTRRVLHDEVLPRLHATMLAMSALSGPSGATPPTELVRELADVHRQISGLLRELPATVNDVLARSGLVSALKQLVADELPEAFDTVTWDVDGETDQHLRGLPSLTAEVVYYAAREAIRNAARHARGDDPTRPLRLHVSASHGAGTRLAITDDGLGLSPAAADADGGHGIALHSTMMAVIGGEWIAETPAGGGTRIILSLP